MQASGLPAVSLQFGAWAGSGMASQHASTALRMERMGLPLLAPAAAIQALESAVRGVSGFVTGMPVLPRASTAPGLVPTLRAPGMATAVPRSEYGSGSAAVLSVNWSVFLRGLSQAAATSPFFARFSHLFEPAGAHSEPSRRPALPAPELGTVYLSTDPSAACAKDEATLREVSALVAESVKNITGKGRLTDKV